MRINFFKKINDFLQLSYNKGDRNISEQMYFQRTKGAATPRIFKIYTIEKFVSITFTNVYHITTHWNMVNMNTYKNISKYTNLIIKQIIEAFFL